MSDRTTVMCELASNESPLGPSPRVVAAIAAEAGRLNRYPVRDDEPLTTALARHYGRGLTPAHCFTASSGYEALDLIARAFLRDGDEALICSPAFPVYTRTARHQRAAVVDVPLDRETFAHDVPRVLDAITPRTKLVYVCNPGNPTGVVMPARDQAALLEAMPAHVVVVLDCVYHHFVEHPAYPDAIGAVLDGQPVVVVHSFSKAYGLAGLRLGYALATPDLVARIAPYRREYHLSRLDVAAGLAALDDEPHRDRVVALVREGRQALVDGLGRLGVRAWPSQANFVLARLGAQADAVHLGLVERGVRVRPTTGFGLPGHLRVSVGLPDDNARFLHALAEVLGVTP